MNPAQLAEIKAGDTVSWTNGKGEQVTKQVELDSDGNRTVKVFGMLCHIEVVAENRKDFRKL